MVAERTEYETTSGLRRAWSAILLVGLSVLLGVFAAGVLGVLLVAGFSLIDHALG